MGSTRSFLRLGVGALLGVVTACGSSTSEVEASIGPEGGTLSLPSPAVRFEVPPGALTATTRLSMRAAADARSVLVTLEPAQLTLGKSGQLSVALDGQRHLSSVSEVISRGEHPIGVDARIEGSSGVSARLRLDRLTQVRVSAAEGGDGGTVVGACHEDGEGRGGEDDHEGEHHDGGEDHDGSDAGVVAPADCPTGFECDDGVCIADDRDDDDCHGADAGTCSDDDDDNGEHEDDHPDGGHP